MHKNNIAFLLSGGGLNHQPINSIGGLISKVKINHDINNLFNDIITQQTSNNYTDYRCFYLVNNDENEKIRDLTLYIHKELKGSEISIGLALQNEVQALMIDGNPTSGRFQLFYILKHGNDTFTNTTRDIDWVPDATFMAQRISAILNSTDFLHGITCVGNQTSVGFDFLITFSGSSGGRAQELLGVINDVTVNITVVRVTSGGPINSVAPNIGMATNPPTGVTFYDMPTLIGNFYPGDILPVWIKRFIPQNLIPVHPDHFRFHLFGDVEKAHFAEKHHTHDIKNPHIKHKSKHRFL